MTSKPSISAELVQGVLDQLLDHVPVGVLIVGPPPGMPVLYANTQYCQFLDEPYHSQRDVTGLSFDEILPPQDARRAIDLIRGVFEAGEPATVSEFSLEGFERGPAYWNARLVPLRAAGGEVEAVLVLVDEATAQVHARARMAELARLAAQRATELSAIIESMAEGVYVCDAQGRLTLVNEAGARLVGMTVEQAQRHLTDFAQTSAVRYADGRPIPPEESPLARALRGETRSDWEQIVRRSDTGEDVYLRVAYAPITDEQGAIVGGVAVANDVTASKQLERQREEFISLAAHELKTPMTSLKLFAQGMLRTLSRRHVLEPERAERDLTTMLRQIDRLTGLVDDMLDMSRIRTGRLAYQFEDLDLVALAGAVVERFRTQSEADSRHHLRLEAAVPSLGVRGDAHRLDQVLTNLLSNAFKYSPAGGDIVVRVEPGDEPGWVRLSVSDHGIGMRSEEIEALFEPYARSASAMSPSRNISGLGLGLYISREIAARHGGRIRAESDGDGHGSTFVVEIPTAPAEEA